MRRDVFQAIADPTRRQIIGLLAAGPQQVNSIAGQFELSRPAISRHLRILTECGLVKFEQKGRERFCRTDWKKLKEVHEWTASYSAFWTAKLDALEAYVTGNRLPSKKK